MKTKSSSGVSGLTSSKSIVEIIKACKEAGVTKFQHGELIIDFQIPSNLTDDTKVLEYSPRSVPSDLVTSEEDMQHELLMLSNPSAYEDLVTVTE